MDIQDVSSAAQFRPILEKQQAALRSAQARRGQKPDLYKSIAHLMQSHMVTYAQMSSMHVDNPHQIHQSWLPPPYPPSTVSIDGLRKIFFEDLRLETHHRGQYILIRAITPALQMTAVMAVMQDENDQGLIIQLFQQRDETNRSAANTISDKDVFVLREPYFKVTNDGYYGLRVDHVSDLVLLSEDDDRIPLSWKSSSHSQTMTSKELKEAGNAGLKRGDPYFALKCYDLALKHCSDSSETYAIKLNRSLVHLRLGYYDKGLEDATQVPAGGKLAEKALYRASRCLYELGKFEECRDTLEKLLADFPDCVEASKELDRTKKCMSEADEGHYDFKAMSKAAENGMPHLDCGTYSKPVTIKTSEGRGRGLFASQYVPAGGLLLCEKAFSYCHAKSKPDAPGQRVSLLMNTHTNRMVMGTQPDLIADTVQKLYHNPSRRSEILSLHHGNYDPGTVAQVDGIAIVDTFLVDQIITLNSFGCPDISRQSHMSKDSDNKYFHSCGIFPQASYINHACYGNARRSFIGDMQIIRAARDIFAGEEILFAYIPFTPEHTFDERQKSLKHWGFQCDCLLCKDMKATKKAMLKNRWNLVKDAKTALSSSSGTDVKKVERLAAAIGETHKVPPGQAPRLLQSEVYLNLTGIYSSLQQPEKALSSAMKSLESLGYAVTLQDGKALQVTKWGLIVDSSVVLWVYVWTTCATIKPQHCAQAEQYARITYKICVGEDETFDQTYGKMAREAKGGGGDLVKQIRGLEI